MSRPTAEDVQLLQNIAPGDVIAMRTYGGWEESWLLQEVTSVTAKRFSCGLHRCFRKKDGREHGSLSRFPAWAFPATPENRARVDEYNCKVRNKRRRQDLIQYLRRTAFKHTPLERLENAVAVLKGDTLLDSDGRQL